METMLNSLPELRIITGKVVSMVVAPPAEMGDNFPKNFTIKGARSKVITSLIILASKAIVPSPTPLY